jgi:hypothetical protein
MANAMKLAAAFARLHQPAADKEGRTCGKLVLQNSRGFWNGADLDLTVGAYRIIKLLASRPGHQHFTYRAIYDRLRHEGFVSGRGPNGYRVNVRSAFKRIRNKFRALDPKFQEIECFRPSATAGASRIDRGVKERHGLPLLRRQPVASAVELVVVGADDHGALVTRWSRPSGFEGCF